MAKSCESSTFLYFICINNSNVELALFQDDSLSEFPLRIFIVSVHQEVM